MRSRTLFLAITLLVLSIAGCKSSLYQWGYYEESLYDMYIDPDDFNLQNDIQRLAQEIEETESKGRRVPPGVYAHVGYLYSLDGNLGAAVEYLKSEKAAFPESAVFIDGMLERLEQ